ncbi:glycosyltransferase family 4 protein [Sulfuricaulis sp.]|jgi:glycosyltransferase involved in cell wall biosynthesis|uniref:glycosyltransferase family 4 protein n=1 Tax=Sulfuricaulis sp. TaxID=2003553 RepID=UPI00355A4A33
MKVVSYVPHGSIPDIRGFAPALIAYNLTKHMRFTTTYTICNLEHYRQRVDYDGRIGDIFRLHEGRIYRRLFRKITRLDPYPLHRRAARIVNRISADVFHAHQIEFPVEDFLRALKKPMPVLIHVNAIRQFRPEMGLATKYISASHYTKTKMIEAGYPQERIEVIYNGVDTEHFSPASADEKTSLRAILGIPSDAVVLTYVGRKQETKGFHTFLQVVWKLSQEHRDIFAVAVGSALYHRDNDREAIAKLLEELKRRGVLLDLPPISHARLPAIYKISDIVLLPTQHAGEQHPAVVIEAQSSGCLILATSLAGIKESIEDGATGFFLHEPGNVEAVAAKTSEVIESRGKLQPVREAARRHAIETFDWKKLSQRLETLYFELAAES